MHMEGLRLRIIAVKVKLKYDFIITIHPLNAIVLIKTLVAYLHMSTTLSIWLVKGSLKEIIATHLFIIPLGP